VLFRSLLPHGRGLVAAWVAGAGELSGLWGTTPPPREQAVGPGGLLALAGPSAGLAVKVDAPAVLQLRSDRALVGSARRPAEPPRDFLQAQGGTLALLLTPGTTAVWLRPPEGDTLSGAAEVLLAPVTPIGEGPGPEALLAPGAARYFWFSVARDGTVGVGVRATPDTASCVLLDAAGRALGEGVVQMPRLQPGAYLLAVRAPADGGPVAVRPALAGIVPPGSGPPDDVVRRYLRLSRGEPEEAPAAPGPQRRPPPRYQEQAPAERPDEAPPETPVEEGD
jgi:hypothetical protein